ncbi:MAG: dTMP kinase [Pseudomonadota bacterium]
MAAPDPSSQVARRAGRGDGFFITVEGADGVGKSTQIERLATLLRGAGHDVVTTREPGGAPGAEEIRSLLVTGGKDRWSPLTEALLMSAARADHLEKTIRPALARGAIVISDRFADSTTAYQGIAGSLGRAATDTLQGIVVGDEMPDLTLILDAPSDLSLARAKTTTASGAQEDRFEEKGAHFQEDVRKAFLAIAASAPSRCAVIDAAADIDAVETQISSIVKERFPELFK